MLLRTVASAIGSSYQVAHIESGRCSDLHPVKRGYFVVLGPMRKYSQSLGHILPFVVPSAILVNTKDSIKIIMNKPDSQR